MTNRELFIGRGAHTGRLYFATPKEYLATHMHLVGASNFGKSFYLEHILRRYIDLRFPASIIDPHGDHAKHYYEFLLRNPRLRRERRIVHFRPSADSNGPRFNPFACGLADPAEVASLVLEAFMKVWGAMSFNETPRLERILRVMFHAFAANGLPLTESYQFLLVANRPYRQNLLAKVADERVRASWEELEQMPKGEKIERFESSQNRLQRFLSTPVLTRLFGAETPTLDFPAMLNRGEILVANLSQLHSTEAQSLVGTMMVNALYHAARRRPESQRKPWFLAIDEFPQFVTSDIARNLDQVRKFGVRLILAHQHLLQVPDELRASLKTNAKIRMVFGGLSRPDAEELAREIFTGDVRGNRLKDQIEQTKFRPHLTPMQVESFSQSRMEGASESDGWSDSESRGDSSSHGGSSSDDSDETVTHMRGSDYGSSRGRSEGRGSSRSESESRSVSTQFVTHHEAFKEVSGRTYWSLEEEWEALVARIMCLEPREALVKVFANPVLDIITPEITRPRLRRARYAPSRKKASGNGGALPETAKPLAMTATDEMPEDFWEKA